MLKILKYFLPTLLFFAVFVPQLAFAQQPNKVDFYSARIIDIQKTTEQIQTDEFSMAELPELSNLAEIELMLLKLKVLTGSKKGENLEIKWSTSSGPRDPELKKGQKVIIGCSTIENKEICNIGGYDRFWPIILLFGIVLVIAIIVAGKKAFNAALTLILSLIIIISVMIPLILKGFSPFYLALIGGGLILLPSVYLAHGFKARSHIALVSMLTMILLVALLSVLFASQFKLLGFTGEESMFIQTNINLYAIMIGGLILATIGVLDDVVITQISVVEEIFNTNRKLKQNELFFKAMKVGRDHIYTVINTLFLVYAGVSLPALILIQQNNVPLLYAIQNESIATEIVRTGVGTIGLILALPLATFLTSYAITKKPKSFDNSGHNHSH